MNIWDNFQKHENKASNKLIDEQTPMHTKKGHNIQNTQLKEYVFVDDKNNFQSTKMAVEVQ